MDEWGVGWRVVPSTFPHGTEYYTDLRAHPLADAAAVARYRPPDPNRDDLYAHAERTIREFGADYWIVGTTVMTIFETAWALRGYEQLLMDFVAEPDLAEEILEIPAPLPPCGRRTVDADGRGHDLAGRRHGHQSGLVISPRHWRHS